MARDTFDKFKSTFNRGVTTISVKTASSLEKVKIKTHIESIERDVENLIVEIGKMTYDNWENKCMDLASVQDKCAIVKQKKEEIAQLKESFSAIDERDGQILGTLPNDDAQEVKTETSKADESLICPNCGAIFTQSVRFCRKCGQQLKE